MKPKADILIVDDDLPGLRLLSNLLSENGYEVRSALDGSSALMMVAAEPPDMVLLDILMPGIDGFQVCEQLKRDPAFRDIPVLFMSARDEVMYKIKGFQVGGVDYIDKPYQTEEVLARIETHLTISRLRAELVRRLIELSALNNIANTFTTKRELPQALEIICKTITDLFGARLAFIALKGGDPADLKGLYGYERARGVISSANEITLPADLLQYLVDNETARSFTITSVENITLSEQVRAYIQENALEFGLIIPLNYQGVKQGILIVAKDESNIAFNQNEIDLAETIAMDISTAIENEYLNEQTRLAAVGAERQRLARELHDSVTQSIYSLTLLSSGWESMARQGTLADPADAFHRLGVVGQQAMREMRLLLHQLRPTVLEEEGLVNAIQQRLDAVERRANIDTQMVVRGNLEGLPHNIEDELFNIAQESLNNSLRHAMAESVVVRIEEDQGAIRLSVEDDGIGFDASKKYSGMGLETMQERANSIAGELSIHSEAANGTRVTISVKTPKETRDK